ncbi:MAG: PD-(D/E)XK nuclease family transposase [Propionibacteriaceae bacterium]|jgi:hypothetical protein|nr:PD-(D/E)XK nuclease family transposase [Propionibacteriaceae bacterium]
MTKLIAPTNDLLFKKTLASEDHKTILQGFIHDFFNLQVSLANLTIQNPYNIHAYDHINPDHPDNPPDHELRQTLHDVAATCPAGDIQTELQIRHEANFTWRVVYYLAARLASHYNNPALAQTNPFGRIDRYSSLIPVRSMNILGFNLFHDHGHALTRLGLLDPDTGRRLNPDPLTLGFFELRKPAPRNNLKLECWRHYWRTGQALDTAPPYIHEAAYIIELANLTRQERDMITATERQRDKIDAMLIYSENQGLERGRAEGKAEGKAEGRAEGKAEGRAEERAAAQTRLAEILRHHPEADHQTILRMMTEADD